MNIPIMYANEILQLSFKYACKSVLKGFSKTDWEYIIEDNNVSKEKRDEMWKIANIVVFNPYALIL